MIVFFCTIALLRRNKIAHSPVGGKAQVRYSLSLFVVGGGEAGLRLRRGRGFNSPPPLRPPPHLTHANCCFWPTREEEGGSSSGGFLTYYDSSCTCHNAEEIAQKSCTLSNKREKGEAEEIVRES